MRGGSCEVPSVKMGCTESTRIGASFRYKHKMSQGKNLWVIKIAAFWFRGEEYKQKQTIWALQGDEG